jgi:hypothetical protein
MALNGLYAVDDPPQTTNKSDEKAITPASKPQAVVKPKPLTDNVKKGIDYLVEQQHADGGWGQGGGWRTGGQGRVEGANVQDPSDVADTCMATLALLRAGHTPREGAYAGNVGRAVEFICGRVDKADKDSLFVTDVRDTQVQSKIGPYADTFLASVVLAELKGKMPAGNSEKRLVAALEKTIHKIEKHQGADGTFAGNDGWAPIFSQGLATKGLNRARQAGVMVNPTVLANADKQAVASAAPAMAATARRVDLGAASARPMGGFGAGGAGRGAGEGTLLSASAPADAGVRLYAFSNQSASLNEAVNTSKLTEKAARDILADKNRPEKEKKEAREQLDRIGKVKEAYQQSVKSVVEQLGDKTFVQGFGSNGGEEFLSYLNIGETLVARGGPEWEKWDRSMTQNLNRIQNKDGSWSGDHCITGRIFCTASALMVLMADRTPVPVAAKLAEKK